jgi:DNA modification methylase
LELNKIYCGEAFEVLKTFESESIDCVVTSPPYWGLRDYGTAEWEGGDINCNHEIKNNIKEIKGDWERPSRKESNKVSELIECAVCGKSFYGKIGAKFCSTACLNTLSNEQRHNTEPIINNICKKCGAKRVDKQLGLEETFTEYIDKLCNIFDEIKRVLKKTGTCFVNLGDTYAGAIGYNKNEREKYLERHPNGLDNEGRFLDRPNKKVSGIKSKSLCQIPSRFAIEMTNRGWILRNELIWWKPSCMPSSAKDRFTVDFEKVFFFVKNRKYYFEQQFEKFKWANYGRRKWNSNSSKLTGIHGGITPAKLLKFYDKINSGKVTGRNKRCVWKVSTQAFHGAHFAVYPEKLIIPMIKSGCPENGIVLDPFMGAGTTGLVSVKLNRSFVGIELNPEYIEIAEKRINAELNNQATKLFT